MLNVALRVFDDSFAGMRYVMLRNVNTRARSYFFCLFIKYGTCLEYLKKLLLTFCW